MEEDRIEYIEEVDRSIREMRRRKAAMHEEYEKGDVEWQHYMNLPRK